MDVLTNLDLGTIITWIILGLIAGYIVHYIRERNLRGDLLPTAITGILGAALGGLIGSQLFGVGVTGLNVSSIVVAVIGAFILSYLQKLLSGNQVEEDRETMRMEETRQNDMRWGYATAGRKGGQTRRGRIVNPVQVEKYLEGIDYPATKDDLLNIAIEKDADDDVIYTLQQLPDREYEGPVGISREIGKLK